VSLLDVFHRDVGLEVHLGHCLRDSDDGLELSDGDGNASALLVDPLVLRLRPIGDVHILEHVASFLRQLGLNLHPGVADVFPQGFQVNLTLNVLHLVHVQANDMTGNGLIRLHFSVVSHDENGVESGQNGTLEVDLLSRMLQVVVPSHEWIGGSQHRGPRVEETLGGICGGTWASECPDGAR